MDPHQTLVLLLVVDEARINCSSSVSSLSLYNPEKSVNGPRRRLCVWDVFFH